MSPAALYFIIQGMIWAGVLAIVLAVSVPLLRWIFRINAIVENQQRIIAELQRLNDNHSSSNNPS